MSYNTRAELIVEAMAKGFEKTTADMNKLAAASTIATKQVTEGSAKSSVAMTHFGNAASLALTGITLKVAHMGAEFVKSSIMLAARADTMAIVTEQMGKNIGYTVAEIRAFEKGVQDMGITTIKSRESIAQLIRANIDLSAASQLARLSQDAAVIANENSSESFGALATIIATGNTLMARRRGLMVNFVGAYKSLAEQLGKTVSELTQAERSQARLNEVLAQGETIAGAYVAALDSAGKKLTSFPRYWEELKVAFGAGFQDIFRDGIVTVTDWVSGMTDAIKAENAIKQAAEDGLITRQKANNMINEATYGAKTFADQLNILAEIERKTGILTEESIDSYEDYVNVMLSMKVLSGELSESQGEYYKSVILSGLALKGTMTRYDMLTESMWNAQFATDGWANSLGNVSNTVIANAESIGSFDTAMLNLHSTISASGPVVMNLIGSFTTYAEEIDKIAGKTGNLSDSISTNLSGEVTKLIERFHFLQAGGGELTISLDKLADAKIAPEIKLEKLQDGYILSKNLEVVLGNLTRDEAAVDIQEMLGLEDIEAAKLLMDGLGTDFATFGQAIDTAISDAESAATTAKKKEKELFDKLIDINDIKLTDIVRAISGEEGSLKSAAIDAGVSVGDVADALMGIDGTIVNTYIHVHTVEVGDGGTTTEKEEEEEGDRGDDAPETGGRATQRKFGGGISPLTLVGEEGQELVVNGVVIPHDLTQQLLKLGVAPGIKRQRGGPLGGPVFGGSGAMQQASGAGLGPGGGIAAGATTSAAMISEVSNIATATQDVATAMEKTVNVSSEQSLLAARQLAAEVTRAIKQSNEQTQTLLEEQNNIVNGLATESGIRFAIADALGEALAAVV